MFRLKLLTFFLECNAFSGKVTPRSGTLTSRIVEEGLRVSRGPLQASESEVVFSINRKNIISVKSVKYLAKKTQAHSNFTKGRVQLPQQDNQLKKV